MPELDRTLRAHLIHARKPAVQTARDDFELLARRRPRGAALPPAPSPRPRKTSSSFSAPMATGRLPNS